MEELLEKLGSAFRGLWLSRECFLGSGKIKKGWAVTFILDGDYAETQYCKTPIEALKFAIAKLKE